MKIEDIINNINKWIGLTPCDERVCLLSMCKNWIKHQESIINQLEAEKKQLFEEVEQYRYRLGLRGGVETKFETTNN